MVDGIYLGDISSGKFFAPCLLLWEMRGCEVVFKVMPEMCFSGQFAFAEFSWAFTELWELSDPYSSHKILTPEVKHSLMGLTKSFCSYSLLAVSPILGTQLTCSPALKGWGVYLVISTHSPLLWFIFAESTALFLAVTSLEVYEQLLCGTNCLAQLDRGLKNKLDKTRCLHGTVVDPIIS